MSATADLLATRLQKAAYNYHNGLTLLMTDEEFDVGVDQLRSLNPAHPFLKTVGAPVAAGDEVALPVPLPSLDKLKLQAEIDKWLSRAPASHYHLSTKLDGCSALWFPATGKLYTRGDGMAGRDISNFAPHFQGLPTNATGIHAVRGELIIRTDSPVIPAGKLARNIVAGILNRKPHEFDATLFAAVRFVAYELISPNDKAPEDAYKLMRKAGFETARESKIPSADMTEARLSEIFSTAEEKCQYQLDGIVIAPNTPRVATYKPEVRNGASQNPTDRMAWKTRLTARTATTTVTAVDWNVSHTGYMIPRVLFTPVQLSGATISAATGLHGRWIYENAVGPGARIEILRAGDVIPKIVAVHVPAEKGPAMPAGGYEWIGDEATAVHIRPASGTVDAEQACIQLTHALGELGAENVGPGLVAKLYAAGFNTIAKIFAASIADFAAKVEGCKGKMAERIWAGIRNGQPSWTELNFMVASCKMPRGVGHTKLKPLLAINPNPATWNAATFKAARPAGISDATIDAIIAATPAYQTWRQENIPASHTTHVTPLPPPPAPSTPTNQMTVVFTEFRDKELRTSLESAGHIVADTITKKTTHVLHPDGPTPTSVKIQKAQSLGITVMTASAFRALL
jgi:DNA ligase (NAD+)